MYAIEFDPQTRIMHIRAEGFWTTATMARFAAEALAKGAAARFRHGAYAVFNDARKFPVQTPEIATAIEGLMARSVKITSGPTASVVDNMLSKLQAERVLKGDKVKVFLDWEEANVWLATQWGHRLAA